MIRCTITIEIADESAMQFAYSPQARLWRAIADAGYVAAGLARKQHDNLTQPPLERNYRSESGYGDVIDVEVTAK